MSLLSIIQDHCKLHALSVPSSVTGSTDTTIIQLWAILQDLLDEMATEASFNVTTQQALHTVIAAADQGAMQTIAPYGYSSAIFETFYDRTLGVPLRGPLTEQEWQERQAIPGAGAWSMFRIKEDHLFLSPTPSAGGTIAFEYNSSWGTKTVAGVLKAAPTIDSDIFVYPENIIRRGLMFKWKQIKGLPYQADETSFYNMLNNYIAKDKVKRRINVAGEGRDMKPGIMVPTTSWPV